MQPSVHAAVLTEVLVTAARCHSHAHGLAMKRTAHSPYRCGLRLRVFSVESYPMRSSLAAISDMSMWQAKGYDTRDVQAYLKVHGKVVCVRMTPSV